MTLEELVRLTLRLVQGPVPTPQKKVYGYQGEIRALLDVLSPAITVRTRVTGACDRNGLPDQAERIPGYLRERLAGGTSGISRRAVVPASS